MDVDYVLGDVQTTAYKRHEDFSVVVMELGILHYFADLSHFVKAVRHLTPENRLMVLNDFHLMIKKAISIESGDIPLTGDYFYSDAEEAPTPNNYHVSAEVPSCLIRAW